MPRGARPSRTYRGPTSRRDVHRSVTSRFPDARRVCGTPAADPRGSDRGVPPCTDDSSLRPRSPWGSAYSPRDRPRPRRLAQLDRRTGHNLAQYVYKTEPVSVPRSSSGGDRGASEMLQLSKTDYLVIERQYVEGENQIQVYRASTKGATDVSRSAALTGTEIPMKKELVIDLAVSGMSPETWRP
ncbi:esterase-like activity of phytase family protein [Kocuria sp. CPCC 205261]|uniref:esterase-like activity of phytase family protein n=1 Tax=Kocuria sp. CPCC 205261 TaxID=3073554 RepID=UPI0034D628CE